MNQEHPADDVFEKRLADWEDRLERGENIYDTINSDSTELLDKKLNRGLACLKQLNNIRRRHNTSSTTQFSKSAELSITSVKFKLPCRFGKFDLLSELGRGGFGVVFLARDRVLDCQVALKMPHAHVLTNVHLRERFIREARVAAGLQHSHIVAVHEAGEVGPVNYIVYAYCPGITLAEWMRVQKDQINAHQAADWVASLAEAVAFAHSKGVLHRDLKPANILLHDPATTSGSTNIVGSHRHGTFTPKITDFGLAKLEREKQQTATGAILGTPTYMAPEQASAKGTIGPTVDIHALGVLLYELLAGHPPYRGENDYETLQLVSKQEPLPLRKLRPKLGRDLETICLKCLQKDPALRYSSASELSADLRRFLAGEPIKARPVSMLERSWRLGRRHPLVTALLIALILTLVGGISSFFYQNHYRGLQADATKAWLQKYLEFLRTNVQGAQELMKDVRTEKQGREKLISLLPYYEALLSEAQTEPSLQREAARLASQAGSIHHSLIEYSKAISRYQQSIEILEQLKKKQGDRSAIVDEQSNALTRLAFTYRIQGKWTDSERIYRQAMEQMAEELQKQPDNTDTLAFLANALVYNCVNLYKQNRTAEAEQDLLLAMNHIEKAISIKSDDDKLLLTQAVVIDDLGLHYMNAKRMKEAENYIQKALSIRQGLFDRNPKSPGIASVLARSHWRLGVFSVRNGKWPDAEEHYTISIKMNDQLMTDYPDYPGYAHNAAWDRIILCDLLEELKRYSDVEALIREALVIRKKCQSKYPQHEDNQYELVTSQFRLAKILRAQGKLNEADQAYQEGLSSNERLTVEFPKEVKPKQDYIKRLQALAKLYDDNQQKDKAEDVYLRLMVAREKLVEACPDVMLYRRDLDSSYTKLANTYRSGRQWQKAADMMARTIPLRQQICDSNEALPQDRHALALRHFTWALDLIELQQHERALYLLTTCIDMEEALARESYQSDTLALDIATARLHEGNVNLSLKQLNKAHVAFSKASSTLERIYFADKRPVHSHLLATCHYALAYTSWQAHHDVIGSAKHYCICVLIKPAFCRLPVNPNWIIQLAHRWIMKSR